MPQEYFDNSRVTLTAHVQGREDSVILWKNNPCKCPEVMIVSANPTSINLGEGVVEITIYIESSGFGVKRREVVCTEPSGLGSLQWSTKQTATERLENERAHVNNSVSGISRATVSRTPDTVESVYQIDEALTESSIGVVTKGPNLYYSHSGKIIDLNTVLTTQTEVVVTYEASGVTKNYFTPAEEGTARIVVAADSNTEAGLESVVSVNIHGLEDDPEDPVVVDPGEDEPEEEHYLTGPSVIYPPTFGTFEQYPYTTTPVWKEIGRWHSNMDSIVAKNLSFQCRQKTGKSGSGRVYVSVLSSSSTMQSFQFEIVANTDTGKSISRSCYLQGY